MKPALNISLCVVSEWSHNALTIAIKTILLPVSTTSRAKTVTLHLRVFER